MSRWFQETFGGLPRAYWTLWTGTLINRLGAFVVPFLGIYLTGARGLPVSLAGFIVSLYGLGGVVAGLVGGVLADHLGRRPTLLLALIGGATSMIALGFAENVAVIAPLVFLTALLSDLSRPAVAAMIADVVPDEHRLRAYGLQYWAINMGFSIAPVAAGFMAGVSYLLLFVLDGATTLAYALLVYLKLPESRVHAPSREPAWRGLAVVVRDRTFVAFAAVGVLVALAYKQNDVSMSVDMMRHGIAPRIYGMVIALNGIVIVLLSPSLSRLLAPLPRLPALAVAAVLTGAGMGINVFAGPRGWPVFAAGTVVWTLGEIISSTVSAAVVAQRAPSHARGRYQGFFTMSWALAAFLGPTLGGLVLGELGREALWGGCLLLGIAAAAGFLSLRKALDRPRV